MDEFLLVMIDRLSTQKKQSRQAVVALCRAYVLMNSFPHSGHKQHGAS